MNGFFSGNLHTDCSWEQNVVTMLIVTLTITFQDLKERHKKHQLQCFTEITHFATQPPKCFHSHKCKCVHSRCGSKSSLLVVSVPANWTQMTQSNSQGSHKLIGTHSAITVKVKTCGWKWWAPTAFATEARLTNHLICWAFSLQWAFKYLISQWP